MIEFIFMLIRRKISKSFKNWKTQQKQLEKHLPSHMTGSKQLIICLHRQNVTCHRSMIWAELCLCDIFCFY